MSQDAQAEHKTAKNNRVVEWRADHVLYHVRFSGIHQGITRRLY